MAADPTPSRAIQCGTWKRKYLAAEETLASIRKAHADEIKKHANVLLHRLEEHELHVQGLEVGDCPLPPATCASRLCLDELCSHTSTSRAQDAATLSKSLVKDLQNKLRAAQVGDTAAVY